MQLRAGKRVVPELCVPYILAEVLKIAAKYPNGKYKPVPGCSNNGCLYNAGKVIDGPPTEGCIVGQAIRNLFPSLLTKMENMEGAISNLVYGLQDTNASLLLQYIQNGQDAGHNWGEAVKLANCRLNMY